MYKYIYVEATVYGFLKPTNHREIIDEYSAKGWRFVDSIPTMSNSHGKINKVDLVFEKEEEA
ncbi:MAG: DUF4177 domain-containing protein [Clostridium sp.]